eukprot:scaffold7843_cov229-Pinguiococcus_pyrenoidosus.AAC.2
MEENQNTLMSARTVRTVRTVPRSQDRKRIRKADWLKGRQVRPPEPPRNQRICSDFYCGSPPRLPSCAVATCHARHAFSGSRARLGR